MEPPRFADPAPPAAAAPTPAGPAALGPVRPGERIVALDVLRGFAILGIFLVNIRLMVRPLADMIEPATSDMAGGEIWAWAFVKALCELKFISLFSLLFGAGLAIQLLRAKAAQRPFVAMYARRLLVLAAIGLVHALAIWYGDILFAYALCGGILLACSRQHARTMITLGAVLFLVGGVLMGGLPLIGVVAAQVDSAAAVEPGAPAEEIAAGESASGESAAEETATGEGAIGEIASEETATEQTVTEQTATGDAPAPPRSRAEAFREAPVETMLNVLMVHQPMSEPWSDLERQAYREGPLAAALTMRWATWFMVLVGGVFSWFWRVVGLFLIGAGCMKLRFFDASRARWHRNCCVVGLTVGLLGEAAATWMLFDRQPGLSWIFAAGGGLRYFTSAFLTVGYVGALTLLVHAGWLRPVTAGLAAVGRLALTNYLAQSLVATAITYWWGAARFDTFTGPQLLALAVAIFAVQILASVLWLRWFRMGPVEWLWRSLTYLRPLPIARS